MRQKRAVWVSWALLILLLVACEPPLPTAELQALPTDAPAPATPSATPTPAKSKAEEKEDAMPTASPQVIVPAGSPAEKIVNAAKADLAERLGIAEEAIAVASIEEMEWPDSSLGCPQPGMMYLQVITPGFRIVLTANGQEYKYHTDLVRAVLCSP